MIKMAHFSSLNLPMSEICDELWKFAKTDIGNIDEFYHFTTPTLDTPANNYNGYNFESIITYYGGTYITYKYTRQQSKWTAKNNRRLCFVKFPCKLYATGRKATTDTFDMYLLVANGTDPVTIGRTYSSNNGQVNITMGASSYGGPTPDAYVEFVSATPTNLDTLVSFIHPTGQIKSKLTDVKNLVSGLTYASQIQSSWGCASSYLSSQAYSDYYGRMVSYSKFPFPVFDINNTNAIASYLNTGDEGGSIDPFDPQNPSVDEITDYKTNFEAYVSLGDPVQPYRGFTNIHWSVKSYNSQYNDKRGIFEGMYRLSVYSAGYPWIEHKTTRAQVPVASYTQAIANNVGNNNTLQFYFGDSDYSLPTPDGYTGKSSGFFLIHYQYKAGSNVKCKIATVKFKTTAFTANWANEGTVLSPVDIGTDAMKYTSPTGETLTIYYRAITLDDLKDMSDEGYRTPTDEEQTASGSDVAFVTGSGLNTFSISSSQFDLINKALWSTDWTQVFKSSTIDPIKCVISCKGIKFANAGAGSVPIIIANRDTDVASGVVNPVKSYTVANCYIPSVNNDFTDISLMRVRCYLPYIGWVDLPSAEVVGRAGYSNVPAVSKRLTFKYIVDFIDGACRCIISVNGTERWYFDGNCAIDIPVTSDNHTGAISTAIKSGLSTALSLGTAVAGAYTGNAGAVAGGVLGSVNNAPNMLPTYEYSASASPSGYINGSSNDHIIVVCEIPNEQIPSGFAHKVGRPCERNLSLASLTGYTQTKNANVSGIDATPNELTMIAQALNSGVVL